MTHLTPPQLLSDQGSDGFAERLYLRVNEAMQAARSQMLQARPFERTDARLGHANGRGDGREQGGR